MTTDRLTLRRMVADRMPGEQSFVLTATGGDPTTFTDAEHVQGPTNAYIGADLWFTSGANLGRERRITSSTNLGDLHWQTPVTAVVAGNTAELWNLRGIGVKASEVNDAIDHAVSVLGRGAWLPLTASVAAAFALATPTVAIPASLTRGIFALDYQDPSYAGVWVEVDGGGEVPNPGWWYDRAGSQIVVGSTWASAIDAKTVRVRGYQLPTALSADASTTTLDKEAVVTEAVYQLCKRNSTKNPEFAGWVKDAWQEKERARPFAVGRRASGTIVFG